MKIMLKDLMRFIILNIVICISVLLSSNLYGQNSIETRLNYIIECASNGRYTELRCEVDSAIDQIEENIEAGHPQNPFIRQYTRVARVL